MKIWNDIIQEYKRGTNLTRVIYSNIAVFISLHILRLLSWLFVSNSSSTVLNFIIANIQTYLNPYILITKPWTVFTYMFTHISFIHLLTNMLMLYWMGRIFIDLLNGKRFVAIYLLGGVAGAIFAVIAYSIIPEFQSIIASGNAIPMIGASASVMAIVTAIGTYVPEYEVHLMFFGKVKLKYIAIVLVIIDILMLPEGINAGGRLAHLGGALFGFLWAQNIKKGVDISKWFMNIMDTVVTWFKPQKKMHVSYRKQKNKAKKSSSYVNYQNVSPSKPKYDQKQ
ncbi:MAG TPA: rhomboid family intramembrane serine protease, partial [Bacteroidales bacterium]|nr:rhomboid family intramembrane serine protease [Bacteroidales bacterium]